MPFDPKVGVVGGAGVPDASTWLDLNALAELKAGARDGRSRETLHAVAQQFESLFLGMMLKSMRDAQLGDSPFESDETRFYQDMFDKQIALSMSHGRGLGIAAMLVQQLGARVGLDDDAAPSGGAARPSTTAFAPQPTGGVPELPAAPAVDGSAALAGAAPVAPVAPVASDEVFAASPAEFVRRVLPHAERAAAQLGTDPRVLVAQAALETGWGRRVPATADGAGYNVFGVKAGRTWSGRQLLRDTLEVENGVPVRTRAAFRAYESLEAGFGDYVALLSGGERYAGVLAAGKDPVRYANALQAAGYATDPGYARKVAAIVDGDTLRDALAALKEPASVPTP